MSATDATCTVTCNAVTLNVATDAGIEVTGRFLRMVSRLTRHVREDGLRRVETSGFTYGGWAAHRNAEPLMAAQAEALLTMTAAARLRLLSGLSCVHREVVVGMNGARSHATVVTVGAEFLFVAIRAEL